MQKAGKIVTWIGIAIVALIMMTQYRTYQTAETYADAEIAARYGTGAELTACL